MTTTLYDQIINQRGTMQNLMARIPGFRGYLEKATRRTADTMLREYIAGQIQQRIDNLIRIEKIILDNGGLQYMSKTRNLKGKIQLYHDKVSSATPGYSAAFSAVTVNEEELERIYAFDEAQIRYVDKLDAMLDKLKQTALQKEGLDEAIIEADDVITEAIQAFELRDDVLTNVSQSI